MKCSVFVGTSVDGFIAREDGSFDFLSAGGEPDDAGGPKGYWAFFRTVDAVVMGRKTYDTVRGFPKWYYGKTPVFVLSRRKLKPARAKASIERLSGSPAAIVRKLNSRGHKHLYIDGGQTIQSFLRAGLIQRIIVTRVPVLIGEGRPLFGPLRNDLRLKLVKSRAFGGGAVQSEYKVLR